MYRKLAERFQGVAAARQWPMTTRGILARLAHDARPYAATLGVAIVLGTVAGLSNLVGPWGFNQIINKVITARHPQLHVLYVALLAPHRSAAA